MNLHVAAEVAPVVEVLAAHVARGCELLRAPVHRHVVLVVAELRERFVALVASVAGARGVRGDVRGESGARREHLRARRTFCRARVLVPLGVLPRRRDLFVVGARVVVVVVGGARRRGALRRRVRAASGRLGRSPVDFRCLVPKFVLSVCVGAMHPTIPRMGLSVREGPPPLFAR